MSDIQRFNLQCFRGEYDMEPESDGVWIRFEDHAKLLSEEKSRADTAYRMIEEEGVKADRLITKLGGLLHRTALALKGPEGELQSHSTHDLPEVAAAQVSYAEGLTGLVKDYLRGLDLRVGFAEPLRKLREFVEEREPLQKGAVDALAEQLKEKWVREDREALQMGDGSEVRDTPRSRRLGIAPVIGTNEANPTNTGAIPAEPEARTERPVTGNSAELRDAAMDALGGLAKTFGIPRNLQAIGDYIGHLEALRDSKPATRDSRCTHPKCECGGDNLCAFLAQDTAP